MNVWRRLFVQNWNLFKASRIGVVGLAIMIAFVILALAAPFMGLRDPIRWTAPDEDLIAVQTFWTKDSITPGSELRGTPPISQAVAFRVLPDSFDPRADRIYVVADNRLYAFATEPDLKGQNAWGTLKFFNVSASDGVARSISVPPIALNFGDYVQNVPDYELYLGTDDGALFIVRDTSDILPSGSTLVRRMDLGAPITGLAAFNGDMEAPFPLAVIGSPNLLSFDGTAWVHEGLPGVGDSGEFASLAFDATGAPNIAYYDLSNGAPRLGVRTPTGWVVQTNIEPFVPTVNVGSYSSLAIGSDGVARIAYYDETEADLKFARANGTSWDVQFLDSPGDVGRFASIALDSSDRPRIAYYDATGGALKFASWDGTAWTLEVVDGSGSVGQFASLAIDPTTGQPHIAYYDAANGDLRYATRPGAVWVVDVVDATDDVGQYASLKLTPSSSPAIAYHDVTNGNLMYVEMVGAVWGAPQVVDAGDDVGRYASLAFDSGGSPAIAYHDAHDLDLKFARWNATSVEWENETLRSAGHVGLHNSLYFDAADRPNIAYYSFRTGRTTRDAVVAGTATGMVYAIDAGIPDAIQRLPREKRVLSWNYRIRWSTNLSSEVHLASRPLARVTNVPLYSPAFDEAGTAVYVGTEDGDLWALRMSDGSTAWLEDDGVTPKTLAVGRPWSSAPIVQRAAEGPHRGEEIVYAASNFVDSDDPDAEPDVSLVYSTIATTGDAIPQWLQEFGGFGGAVPVGPTLGEADGGDLAQPSVEGGIIYVGSTSGYMYAYRRDGLGAQPPASLKWKYFDQALLGLEAQFTSPSVVLSEKGLMLTTANHNNGTADPADDRGVLYSFKLDGSISWRKSFPSRIPGQPASWTAPRSLQQAVWVGYGGDVVGVQSLSSTGSFLAPSPPSWVTPYPSGNQYWLGLDSQGRDIFSQVIWGSRIALLVGFLAAFFTVLIGVVVGLIAGYVGGKVESVLMRFTDVILVLPGLPLIITLAAVLGASIWNIILVISLLGWPGIARIIRAEVLSLKERPFIDSARVTGASTTRIVFRHLAPNVMPLAFLYMTFAVSGAILTEAALSFIGLGDINTMSWGIMLQLVSQSKALTAWWWLLPPGIAITLISLAFFLVGRAFDEIVNPRLRRR